MKHYFLITFFYVLISSGAIWGWVACGPSQEEYDALSNKYSKLQKDYAELEKLRKADQERINELVAENSAMAAKLEDLGVRLSELDADLASAKEMNEKLRIQKDLAKQRLETLKNMLVKFKNLIAAGKLKVKIKEGKMFLELPSAILFPSGKATLSEEGKATLTEVAAVLTQIQGREFLVAGHTDNVPIQNPKYPSNWELSTARAVAVVKFLQEMGVDPHNLAAAGYSEYQPAVDNSTEEGRAQNRRIEITLMPNLNELPDLSDLEKEIE